LSRRTRVETEVAKNGVLRKPQRELVFDQLEVQSTILSALLARVL
jgi:hypothetical protein